MGVLNMEVGWLAMKFTTFSNHDIHIHEFDPCWINTCLVGGWTNPFEKYAPQNGFIFPNFRGENKK